LNEAKNTETYEAVKIAGGTVREAALELIGEEPLLIRVEGRPFSVVMRTPGSELFHAAGFCLGEGLVDGRDDFLTLGYCRDLDPNVVEVRLRPERLAKIGDILERRSFVSQTSCGICGKEMVRDLYQKLEVAVDDFTVEAGRLFGCLSRLFQSQSYYPRTKGSHAALIFDRNLEELSFAEDVGRHNALDKAVGKAFMEGSLEGARLLAMSSRISFELVQKAARARLQVLVSKSRPTALAVAMGRSLNMTIASAFDDSELIIFCGQDRIVGRKNVSEPK